MLGEELVTLEEAVLKEAQHTYDLEDSCAE